MKKGILFFISVKISETRSNHDKLNITHAKKRKSPNSRKKTKLIPKSSGFFSTALMKTFALVSKHITLACLEQLKSALFVTSLNDANAEESMEEDNDEHDDDEHDDDECNNEKAVDEEMNKEEKETSNDEDLEDEEEESDLEDEETGTVAEEFRNKVLQALGPAAAGYEVII